MTRSKHKPSPATVGVYRPGVGYTITRANIAWASRVRANLPGRYLYRAQLLLRPKGGA